MTILLTIIQRPKTAPLGLLAIGLSIFVTDIALLMNSTPTFRLPYISLAIEGFAAMNLVIFCFRMPLRDPGRPNHQISPAFEKSTYNLRSPEDNLTLWQFMTVSWMSPLIGTGYARQLNDEDVWRLGYEFQHELLHNHFTDLEGSVTKRLLLANSQDVIINFVLAIVESVAGEFTFHCSLNAV